MRFGVLALAGLFALPAAAAAQGGFSADPVQDLVPSTKWAVTPWIGYRIPTGSGDAFVTGTESGTQYVVDQEYGGSWAVGLNGEMRLTGPVSLVGSVGYSGSGSDDVAIIDDGETVGGFSIDGPRVLFAKAGVSYRLPDPIPDDRRFHPAAFVTVAPAVVYMDYPELDGFDDDVTGSSTHFGLNLGVDAVTMLNSRGIALNLGLENTFTFFDQDRVALRDQALLGTVQEEPVVVDYDYSVSNLFLFRAGISWRF